MGRPRKYAVALSDAQVATLLEKAQDPSVSRTIQNRCLVLLDLDENHPPVLTQEQSASKHGISRKAAGAAARMLNEKGLESVLNLSRNRSPDSFHTKVTPEMEQYILELVKKPVPEGCSHWYLRLIEQNVNQVFSPGINKETIRRVLKRNS